MPRGGFGSFACCSIGFVIAICLVVRPFVTRIVALGNKVFDIRMPFWVVFGLLGFRLFKRDVKLL